MQGDENQLICRQARASKALLAAMSAGGASVVKAAGYMCYFWSEMDVFYRSMAFPLTQLAYSSASLAAMTASFVAAGRQPRAEFFKESWPGLQETLARAGWKTEMRSAAMWIRQIEPMPTHIDIHSLEQNARPEEIWAFLNAMGQAFDVPQSVKECEVHSLRRGLEKNRLFTAYFRQDGAIQAGAALSHCDRTAELQGVWVQQSYRRQGIAEALCRHLLQDYLAVKDRMVWLSAGGSDSHALYDKLGFKPMGTQVNMCLA